jgi:hypothetical protein
MEMAGEKLADWLGITGSKYQEYYDEFQKQKEEVISSPPPG